MSSLSARAVAAVAVLALLAGVLTAKASAQFGPTLVPRDDAARRQIALERQAVDLINRAGAEIRRRRPSCAAPASPPRRTSTDQAPSPRLLGSIAALRRPATAEDERLLDPRADRGPYARGVYRRYARVLTTASGRRLAVVAAQDTSFPLGTSPACRRATARAVARLAEQQPAELAAAVHRIDAQLRRQEGTADTDPHEGIYLFQVARDGRTGSGGGGGSVARFQRYGTAIALGGARGSRVDVLVPDGVASVQVVIPKVVDEGPLYRPLRFDTAIRRTVRVHDNVVSVAIARPIEVVLRARMVWRDRAGRVLRVAPLL